MVDGGAADLAGLQCGDRILQVSGTRVVDYTHAACVQTIKSATGGQVDLLVSRYCAETPTTTDVLVDIELKGPTESLGIKIRPFPNGR